MLAGWRHTYSGKVRDLYEPETGDGAFLLVVASDRISAFDHVLEPPISGKGALLTGLSRWWFDQLDVPNHLVDADAIRRGERGNPAAPPVPDEVGARAMLTRKLEMYPIECVVRGALTGSGYAEYRETGAVCGIELPAGITDGDLLGEPIYTPAYKAPLGEHDENITFERSAELVGSEVAAQLRDASLAIFTRARELAAARGLVLADTKFEFGRTADGRILLIDEVMTPDSSRFWPLDGYAEGRPQPSFDKQPLRDWLDVERHAGRWNGEAPAPRLPAEVVEATSKRYLEAYRRLTGADLPVS